VTPERGEDVSRHRRVYPDVREPSATKGVDDVAQSSAAMAPTSSRFRRLAPGKTPGRHASWVQQRPEAPGAARPGGVALRPASTHRDWRVLGRCGRGQPSGWPVEC